MGNLFSSFDPRANFLTFSFRVNWLAVVSPLLFMPQLFWLRGSQSGKTVQSIILYLNGELAALFGALAIPGTASVFIRIFFIIIFSNFIGLFPYVFTGSSHLRITLALGLPLWLGIIIWSLTFQLRRFISHLVPSGTPPVLIPFIVLIESVRNVIRPGTLSIRLAANMVAGHLLLTLLGSQGPAIGSLFLFLFLGLFLLLLLEVGVACIQAYVFTVLSSLYLSEVIRPAFNKQIRYVKFFMSPLSYCRRISLTFTRVDWRSFFNQWNSRLISSRRYKADNCGS